MKALFLMMIIVYFPYCQGKPGNGSIEKKFFAEKNVPINTLEFFISLLKLKNLDAGDNNFEIRKWGPFINDTFPVFMERYFYGNEGFKGEVYFFCKKNGHPILSSNDLKNSSDIKFEKNSLGNLPKRYMDSLNGNYNLFKIDSFDSEAINKLYKKGYILHHVSMLLIEQLSNAKYISIFTRYPESFAHINPNYKTLSMFYRFTEDNLLLRNDTIKKWIDDRTLSLIQHLHQ